ncbi:MAG: glutaconyl-CoA decarboxylase subunit beta, partial [Flavobacteriia bacterium]
MKKLILIFGILTFLFAIKPVLGLNKNGDTLAIQNSVSAKQSEASEGEGVFEGAFDGLKKFYSYTGFANATGGNLAMIFIGIIFIYLGIKYDYEPLLLIPIGVG